MLVLRILMLSCLSATFAISADAEQDAKRSWRTYRDVPFAEVDGHTLTLDLFLPAEVSDPIPCIVFVHGGGWLNGDKKSGEKNAAWITERGFAVASINYRLTGVAQWPAQINDCYAAVRWVRENATKHGIDPKRVGAWGTSAGGHLVALMGTRRYDGDEKTSSQVQAVCDWFGPSELLTMPPNNVSETRSEEAVAKSNGAKLLGATVKDVPGLAKDASALDQVSSDDAAFLIMHGDQDPGVPIEQSQKLHKALLAAGVPSTMIVVAGAGHGGKEFQTAKHREKVAQFFTKYLKDECN